LPRRSEDEERVRGMYDAESGWRQKYGSVAGVDEVGRGPMAGPVVAAAVMLPKGSMVFGIDDSKKLSGKTRERLFDLILQDALAFGVGIRSSQYIDKHGIVPATFSAMRLALSMLSLKGFPPGFVLVDGFPIPGLEIPQEGVVRGDATMASIACASIIAKVTRDRIMDGYADLYPDYGFEGHKGYCTREHRSRLSRFGPCPIHRRSFSPVGDSERDLE
jgi:ribonuclease HII